MTELIIKVDDDFLREAKLKGMEKQFELVRCKDCKYWAGENGERITIPAHENCYFFVADDFCSYGERKDGEEECNGQEAMSI